MQDTDIHFPLRLDSRHLYECRIITLHRISSEHRQCLHFHLESNYLCQDYYWNSHRLMLRATNHARGRTDHAHQLSSSSGLTRIPLHRKGRTDKDVRKVTIIPYYSGCTNWRLLRTQGTRIDIFGFLTHRHCHSENPLRNFVSRIAVDCSQACSFSIWVSWNRYVGFRLGTTTFFISVIYLAVLYSKGLLTPIFFLKP